MVKAPQHSSLFHLSNDQSYVHEVSLQDCYIDCNIHAVIRLVSHRTGSKASAPHTRSAAPPRQSSRRKRSATPTAQPSPRRRARNRPPPACRSALVPARPARFARMPLPHMGEQSQHAALHSAHSSPQPQAQSAPMLVACASLAHAYTGRISWLVNLSVFVAGTGSPSVLCS